MSGAKLLIFYLCFLYLFIGIIGDDKTGPQSIMAQPFFGFSHNFVWFLSGEKKKHSLAFVPCTVCLHKLRLLCVCSYALNEKSYQLFLVETGK